MIRVAYSSAWAAGAVTSALIVASTPAVAQSLALEEVLVTAEKKAESLQDTPISLTAFGEEQLEKDGIGSLADIGSSVPSLTIEPFPINNSTLRIFIRGIGLIDAQLTQDPPVGVYADGAYIARSSGLSLDIADLARIEVLRGPQGTLYGRNSTGGAINLVTKRPSAEALEFSEKLTIGNRGLFSSKTSLNVPLTESAAIKLAYLVSDRDGFIDNTGPGGNYGDKETEGWRFDAGWDVTDRLRLDFAYDKAKLDYFNYAYQAVIPATVNPRPANAGEAIQAQLAANSQSYFTFTDKRVSSMTSPVPLDNSFSNISGYSLTAQYDLGETTQLKYIYAWRDLEDGSFSDLPASGNGNYRIDNGDYTSRDGTVFVPGVIRVLEQEQRSHELQLTGEFFDSRVEYIAGLYYFEEEAVEDNAPLHHQFTGPLRIINDGTTTTTVTLSNFNSQYFTIENEAWAAFARLTWTVPIMDDRLRLTLGARHSEDKRQAFKDYSTESYTEGETRLNANGMVVRAIPRSPVAAGSAGWTEDAAADFADDSFEFIAEFDLSDDINVYGKYVEAYKSGGYNTRDPDQARFDRGFSEEKVASWELGVKSELMGRRLRINGDVFFSEYTDIQLNFLIGSSIADTQVVNAGKGEMQGAEMDLTFLASENLLLTLNYAYLDAEITEATDPDTGADVTDTFTFSAAPRHSYTAAFDWTIANLGWGRLGLNMSYNYMDDRAGSNRTATAKKVYLEDYDLFNARLGLYDISLFGGQLNVALWGKNLADTEYVINAVDNLPHADRAVIWGEPRSYGIDLIYNF